MKRFACRLGRWLAVVFLSATFFPFAPAWAADVERLALKGYDPVAYFTLARAVPGEPQFQTEWDGSIYRFVSADHQALFKADPDRYLPQYGNLCTATLAGGSKRVADPRYWLVHEGRLFLFGIPEGVAKMSKNPAAMKTRADTGLSHLSRP